jgi:hypothetical protein
MSTELRVGSNIGPKPGDASTNIKKAQETKNPLELKSFSERNAAIESKLVRISKDSRYQGLSNKGKVMLRQKLYNEYVVPTFKQAGLQVPDNKTWLQGTINTDHINPEQQFRSTGSDVIGQTVTRATKSAIEMTLAGVKMTHRQWLGNVSNSYDFIDKVLPYSDVIKHYDEASEKFIQKQFSKAESFLQEGINQQNYWLETHPSKSMLASAGGWTGDIIAQLPMYEALGAVTAPAEAIAAAKVAKVAAGSGRLAMSAKLAQSPVGRWVGRRLVNAADGFIYQTGVQGKDNKEGLKTGAEWALAGGVLEPATHGVIASSSAIKRWTGNLIAMGGKPFAFNVMEAAMAEAFNGHLDIGIVPKYEIPKVGSEQVPIFKPLQKHEMDYVNIGGKNAHQLGNVTVAPTETFPQAGHLVHDGKIYPYGNLDEMQKQYNYLASLSEKKRAAEDPVIDKVTKAEGKALRDLSQKMYGHRKLSALSPEQQIGLLKQRSVLIHEAAEELPAHVPDLVKAEQQQTIGESNKQNPITNKYTEKLKALGVDPVQVATDNIVDDTKKKTGIKNSENAAKKVAGNKATKKSELVKLRAMHDVVYSMKDDPQFSATVIPLTKDIFKAKEDTVAYFKNKNPRLASDGTNIGARDKRTWNERLSAENTKQFVETLKMADGGLIKFEKDQDRLLYHWGNKTQLPENVKNKVLYELKKAYPKYAAGDFDKASDNLGIHLIKLAKTGELAEDGNVFKSSNFFQKPTKWQAMLNVDMEEQEIEMINNALEQHPEVQDNFQSLVEMFQQKRRASEFSPDAWLTYNNVIDNLISGTIGVKGNAR